MQYVIEEVGMRELMLRRRVMIQQLPQYAEADGAVRKARFSGVFQRFGRMLYRQREQSMQCAFLRCRGRAASPAPLMGVVASGLDVPQQPRGATFQAVDLLGHEMFADRAEPPRLAPHVQCDLLETIIEQPHQPRIPPHRTPCGPRIPAASSSMALATST